MTDALIRYSHYLGLVLLFAFITSQHVLLGARVDGATARRARRIGYLAWAAAVLVLLSGTAMLLGHGYGKEWSYYLRNGLFHGKLTAVVVVIVLMLPTTRFLGHQHHLSDQAQVSVPFSVRMGQRLQLLLLVLIPLLAILITRGIGAKG